MNGKFLFTPVSIHAFLSCIHSCIRFGKTRIYFFNCNKEYLLDVFCLQAWQKLFKTFMLFELLWPLWTWRRIAWSSHLHAVFWSWSTDMLIHLPHISRLYWGWTFTSGGEEIQVNYFANHIRSACLFVSFYKHWEL